MKTFLLKRPWLLVVLLGIPLIEIAATILLTKYLGALPTYVLFAALSLGGLWLQWRRWPQIKGLLKQSADGLDVYRDDEHKLRRHEVFDPFAQWVLFWVVCLLLLFPGFVTDVLAFALMLPPVKRRALAYLFDAAKPRLPLF